MAGGMHRRGGGVPLGERRRAGATPPAPGLGPAAQDARGSETTPACPVRHCWVVEEPPGRPRPGLLVEWRQAGTEWEGRVVYAVAAPTGRWRLVEEWLPARVLTPR